MRVRRSAERDPLRDSVVVITGASSGFGRGAALAFANAGATVVLGARRREVLDDVARECEAAGAIAVVIETDVSDAVEVSRLARAAVERFGRIDVWVNNAGAGAIGRFDEIPLEDHVQVVETTLLGTLYGSYIALRQFRRQGRGTLINMGSIAGKVAAPFYASYVAAKHGVVGLSAALRKELEQDGEEAGDIHVCTVLPDAHDTPFFQHAANYSGHEVVPPPPVHDPTEVVEAIVSLALDPTRDETIVGAAGKASAATARVSRAAAEAMMSRAHGRQMEAPLAPPSEGSLTRPSPIGTGVTGGWKEKEKEEKQGKRTRRRPSARAGRPEV
jgi:short-subunit dehydrogenase